MSTLQAFQEISALFGRLPRTIKDGVGGGTFHETIFGDNLQYLRFCSNKCFQKFEHLFQNMKAFIRYPGLCLPKTALHEIRAILKEGPDSVNSTLETLISCFAHEVTNRKSIEFLLGIRDSKPAELAAKVNLPTLIDSLYAPIFNEWRDKVQFFGEQEFSLLREKTSFTDLLENTNNLFVLFYLLKEALNNSDSTHELAPDTVHYEWTDTAAHELAPDTAANEWPDTAVYEWADAAANEFAPDTAAHEWPDTAAAFDPTSFIPTALGGEETANDPHTLYDQIVLTQKIVAAVIEKFIPVHIPFFHHVLTDEDCSISAAVKHTIKYIIEPGSDIPKFSIEDRISELSRILKMSIVERLVDLGENWMDEKKCNVHFLVDQIKRRQSLVSLESSKDYGFRAYDWVESVKGKSADLAYTLLAPSFILDDMEIEFWNASLAEGDVEWAFFGMARPSLTELLKKCLDDPKNSMAYIGGPDDTIDLHDGSESSSIQGLLNFLLGRVRRCAALGSQKGSDKLFSDGSKVYFVSQEFQQ
jgi:hypothetical protein